MNKTTVTTVALGILMSGYALPSLAMDMDDHGMKNDMKSEKTMKSEDMTHKDMKSEKMMKSDKTMHDHMKGKMEKHNDMMDDNHMDKGM